MTPGSSQMPPAEDVEAPNDDALSPTDGYFHTLPPLPQDEMIPDPEQRNTPASKEQEAREAQEERARRESQRLAPASSQRPHSPAASSIVSASSRRTVDTTFDDLDERRTHRPRLPTYDDAVAERPYIGPPFSSTTPGFYGTVRPVSASAATEQPGHVRDHPSIISESRPLLSANNGSEDSDSGVWRHRLFQRNVFSKTKFRRKLKRFLMCLLFISIVTILLKLLVFIDGNRKPDSNTSPNRPSDGTPPDAHKTCPNFKHHDKASLEISKTEDFGFAQVASNKQPAWGRTRRIRQGGEIRLTSSISQTGISASIDVYSSHDSLSQRVGLNNENNIILLKLPTLYTDYFDEKEALCMYTVAQLVVPSGTNFTALYIVSETMDIVVDENLDLGAETMTFNLTSLAGSIKFPSSISRIPSLHARDIMVETETGSITGAYPLHDSLDLESARGSIDVQIDLKETNKFAPKSAELTVRTTAGEIRVIEPAVQKARQEGQASGRARSLIPVRDYRSILHSTVGNIKADLVHGSRTEIGGNAGRMDIVLSPYGRQRHDSLFKLQTTSASADLLLTHQLDDPAAVIDNLTTILKTATGNLRLAFPDTWRGIVDSSSVSGKIMVDWPSFHVRQRGKDPFHIPFSYLSGYVGNGSSLLSCQTISGATKLIGYGHDAKQWRDAIL